MELITLDILDIKPYKNNPRINDLAVDAVRESIRQCSYIAPIVIDEDYVILAGHTRHTALYREGATKAECIVVSNLSEEQKRKFRLLDNKTNEIASWDIEKLIDELDYLDLGDFSYFEDLINEAATNLLETGSVKDSKEKKEKDICCPRCGATAHRKK